MDCVCALKNVVAGDLDGNDYFITWVLYRCHREVIWEENCKWLFWTLLGNMFMVFCVCAQIQLCIALPHAEYSLPLSRSKLLRVLSLGQPG